MTFSRICLRSCFCAGLVAMPSPAADFVCPASLSVSQTATRVPLGWEAISSAEPLSLERVALYLGNPKEGGVLVPDKTDKQGGVERLTWTFARRPSDEFWLGCSYTGTTVILAQKLKRDVSQCVVQYDLLPSGSRLRVKAISCTLMK